MLKSCINHTIFLSSKISNIPNDNSDKERTFRMVASNQKLEQGVLGIHHITAIARNPQRNVDFYSNSAWG